MRILYLIEELGGGGKERRLVELIKGLSRDKEFKIHLLLTKGILDYREIHQLPITIHKLNDNSKLELFHRYFLKIKEIKPDIIHTWSFKTSFYAAILKSFFNYKFIAGYITNTFGFSKYSSILHLLIFRRANLILSNSRLGLKVYKVPLKKGYVIPNGFDFHRLKRKSSHKSYLKELGINSKLIIIMVANVTPKKDYETFIRVAEFITKKNNDVCFVSVGNIHSEYKELVFPYLDNKHDKIKFLGFYDNPIRLIQDSHIGLLCSDKEGISNAIMEYMAAGLPVVTTDIEGASKELLTNNVNGIICSKQDLFQQLSALIDNEELRKKFSRNNIKKIKNIFSIEAMISKHIEAYRSI